MGDVEIVVKVPERVPKEIVKRAVDEKIMKIKLAEKYFGALKEYPLSKYLEKVDEEWGLASFKLTQLGPLGECLVMGKAEKK
ncbi:hypothetical protein [Thermococcus stetteri]|uniref:hypothetical protein n=1 Tax=Thermococcus stetteri TaxID=49900 RepID=UPI001AE583F2|nr:hypothetical protein [Thermococcus stetteri]MBP1912926.1 hypothetical protein [Thermococcus stetteri]